MTPLEYNRGQISGLCILANQKIHPAFYWSDVGLADMSLEGRVLVRGRVGLGLGGLILEEVSKTAEIAYNYHDRKFPLYTNIKYSDIPGIYG